MQKCKQCEWEFPDDIHICPYCGHPVDPEDQKQKRRFNLRWHPGTLPRVVKGPGLAASRTTPNTLSRKHLQVVIITCTIIAALLLTGIVWARAILIPPSHPDQPLIVNPSLLDYGKVLVGDKPTRTLTVENSSGLPLHWTADTTKASRLKLDTNSGDLGPNTQKTVKVTMDTSGLPPRPVPYSAIVSFNTNEMSTLIKTTVTVIAPGKLFVTVGNCGAQPLSWFISAGKMSWITLSSTQGTIEPGKQQMVRVTVDTSQLTPSSKAYTTSLTFSSNKGSQIVSITVTVSSQPPPPKRVPIWSVDPMNLDPSNSMCVNKGDTWTCTVTLREDTSSLGNINWSPTSNLGATFNPPGGQLMPGGPQRVTISSIYCQNNTFTFYGAEDETPIIISWSCNPPCITVDQNSLHITVMQGQPSTTQNVIFTNCGADMGNLKILPTTSDGASWLNISPINTQSLNEPLASKMGQAVSVSVTSTNQQPGMYQGAITASITTNTGTTTATANVMLTVSPCFKVDQSSLSFTYPGEGGAQEVTFTNCGTYAGDVSISSSTSDGGNWLFVKGPTSGSLGAGATDHLFVGVGFSHVKLIPGIYQGTISATLTTNGIAAPAPVSVTLTVLSAPHMTVSSSNLDFGSVQQGQTASQQLTIGNTGGQTLSWAGAAGSAGWVTLDTGNGRVQANGQQMIKVTVDTTDLKVGNYSTTLTLTSNADNSPVQVTITLAVTLPPNMQVSPASLSFDTCSTTPSSQNLTITNTGGGTLTWTIGTPSASWLTVKLISGSNSDAPGQSSTLEFTVDKTQVGDATVVITSADGETATVAVSNNPCPQAIK
jgi:hypothetical protein